LNGFAIGGLNIAHATSFHQSGRSYRRYWPNTDETIRIATLTENSGARGTNFLGPAIVERRPVLH
jgi:hypothetical protein